MFEAQRGVNATPSLVIGVDVGGTFTDVFVLDEALGSIQVLKVPSTVGRASGDQSQGFLAGIREALKVATTDGAHAAITTIVHGTTAGTNALLERKIARTGLITTRGFRDVLEMRRRDRPSTWGLWGQFEPIIERRLRAEVDERVLADGTVLEAVNLEQVKQETKRLRALGCEALVIAFINAYANPINEQQALDAALQAWGEADPGTLSAVKSSSPKLGTEARYVSASHQILPEIREFERTSTAALNAALQPVVGKYVQRLDDGLKQAGFLGQLLIVQSNGGVMDVATTCQAPVKTALSGPAAGVMACAFLARESGYPNVITGDMGGTSFDVSLVAKGQPALASQTSIEFGMVIRSPMIEITTIGAGGGSVASVDSSGLLQVGPQSAGSYPGPVCYGLRASAGASTTLGPCVTDANVVLGRINAQKPIGKLPALDVAAARRAIASHVGDPLGLGVEAAAEAILAVANAKMAGAIRLVSIERGHDPKLFAYMPFGGGGALHVCAMMKEVGVTQGIVPRYPGVTSALGCVIADMRRDYVRTLNQPLALVAEDGLRASIQSFVTQGRQALKDSRVKFAGEACAVELDMLYQGQSHTLSVPLSAEDALAPNFGIKTIEAAFVLAYRASFGQALEGVPMRLMNLRVAMIGIRPKFELRLMSPKPLSPEGSATGSDSPALAGPVAMRPVFHTGRWLDTPIFARLDLPIGFKVQGPALFEQADTTVWLEPGFQAEVDRLGNLLIQVSKAAS
jgi:N-methylhydantoinase A